MIRTTRYATPTWFRNAACLPLLAATSACVFMPPTGARVSAVDAAVPVTVPNPEAPRLPVLSMRQFGSVSSEQEVLGEVQVLLARYENTFVEIARRHNLGYDSLRNANPAVDVWLPGEDTPVYLPTMTVLPDAPRDGIVLNLPSMRLLYFVADEIDDDGLDSAAVAPTFSVTSHPVGIGREGWATPTGTGEVTDRARDPTWYPPASVRAEHEALGDPLPAVVPPGPDNPLGRFALALSLPGYLIHGTNKPAGVGMRVSHGCIRLYPEDIEALFDRVPSGTKVHIVDQPVLAGWRDGQLYLEVHPPLAEDPRDLHAEAERVIGAALTRAGVADVELDWAAISTVVVERRGVPFPIMGFDHTLDQYLASARLIHNDVPVGPQETTASR